MNNAKHFLSHLLLFKGNDYMFRIIIAVLLFSGSASVVSAKECSPLLDFELRTLNDKKKINLCEKYQGNVLLLVNTASKCGYTDQYDDLEKLYSEYKNKGLVVLGFPSNDFGGQEPGTEKQIRDFCRLTYGVKFPMFSKTKIKGDNAHPLYQKLYAESGEIPRWNFHKYLIDREGKLVASFPSALKPYSSQLISKIESSL
jgi:glutathione peroxidase